MSRCFSHKQAKQRKLSCMAMRCPRCRGGPKKRICSCSASQISCSMCIVPGSCCRWGRLLKTMHVTHDQRHHGKAAQEAARNHQSLLCDLQCNQACCDCPQLVSACVALSSSHGIWRSGCRVQTAPGLNHPCTEQVFLLLQTKMVIVLFYPHITHNNN